jgi:putative sterol carrier protein
MSAESYVHLRKLTVREGEPIEDILQRGAEHLRGLGEKATIQFRFTDSGSTYSILLTPSGAFVHPKHLTKPTLVVITNSKDFYHIAEGSYSPLQAYLDGKMRILGNVELGRQIIKHLSNGTGTQVNVCPILVAESWELDGPGYGSVTLTGDFFTPGGTVEIVYNWGGGFYQQIVTADSSGSFTVTQGDIYCGDIPGDPGVGVIVTATDISTGKYTTKNYSTPC